jgi:hypothetical protein
MDYYVTDKSNTTTTMWRAVINTVRGELENSVVREHQMGFVSDSLILGIISSNCSLSNG